MIRKRNRWHTLAAAASAAVVTVALTPVFASPVAAETRSAVGEDCADSWMSIKAMQETFGAYYLHACSGQGNSIVGRPYADVMWAPGKPKNCKEIIVAVYTHPQLDRVSYAKFKCPTWRFEKPSVARYSKGAKLKKGKWYMIAVTLGKPGGPASNATARFKAD
ncbi:hypothetical protein [Nonomuraea sp. B19D2]|uniref:hypothetical protein n=1 Tax=Nonomuraea sp. B19D2 TaxID=3159561 RepID=UPI0032DAB92E